MDGSQLLATCKEVFWLKRPNTSTLSIYYALYFAGYFPASSISQLTGTCQYASCLDRLHTMALLLQSEQIRADINKMFT